MNQGLRNKINRNPFLHKVAYFIKNMQGKRYYHKYSNDSNSVTRFKGVGKGKKCFVIGNGPSLSPEDLDRLADLGIDTFACNKIYLLYDRCGWRPTYYLAQDCYVNDAELLVRADAGALFIASELWNNIKPDIPNACIYHNVRMDTMKVKRMEDDFAKCACSFGSVTHVAIQAAVYMGYEEIYLLGVDHSYPVAYDANWNIIRDDVTEAHFYKQQNSSLANIELMTKGFAIARQYAETHNVKVLNATRGGRLEVFERVEVDKLFDELSRA